MNGAKTLGGQQGAAIVVIHAEDGRRVWWARAGNSLYSGSGRGRNGGDNLRLERGARKAVVALESGGIDWNLPALAAGIFALCTDAAKAVSIGDGGSGQWTQCVTLGERKWTDGRPTGC
jgi:hypothetical protein